MRKKSLFLMSLLVSSMMAWADASGSCGDGVTYSYVASNHTLTISKTGEGTGGMTRSPWESSSYKNEITSVVIEDGVTSICDYAFQFCSGITSVTIPNSVTSIGGSAFFLCTSLASITIGSGVETIKTGAFYGCSSLTSVTIGRSMTSIGSYAFSGSPIETVTFENGLTSIGDSWFQACTSLTTVNIPNSVTSIGNNAFDGCLYLTSINIPGNLTSIGEQAFWYCDGLTSIDIPSSVTSIGANAFNYCSSLTTVTCWATTPPTLGSSAFPSSSTNIYVPSVAAYKDESNWDAYYATSRLYPISEAPSATMSLATRQIPSGDFEGYWTTFYYSGANMQAPDGVTVYKATIGGSSLSLSPIADRIINAGQAVVLKKAAAGSIVLTVTASTTSGSYTGNSLLGVDKNTACSSLANYTLANGSKGLGFYKYSGTTLGANKAYMPVTTPAHEFLFSFDEETTGLKTIEKLTMDNESVYDLLGRKVQQPVRGIYAKNGRKFIVK